MDERHAPRREPETPSGTLTLSSAADDLLETARDQRSGRAARALLPGAGLGLSQTLLALTADTLMQEHAAPGPATLQVLIGAVRVRWADGELELGAGDWGSLPDERHDLHADSDSVCLLTVGPR
jgi:quercetin dioxygenase-like cupin family protein